MTEAGGGRVPPRRGGSSSSQAAGEESLATPPARDAESWIGSVIDDVGGVAVGRVSSLYVDAESGAAAWLAVAIERRRLLRRRVAKTVVVPARECAALPGRAWTAEPAGALREAPAVDPSRPLLREHELALCAHYGIGERVGRSAEIAGRAEGSVTARPA